MGTVSKLPARVRQEPIFDSKAIDVARQLEDAGAVDIISFGHQLDPALPIEQWAGLGGYFGVVNKASRFWLGDWLNWGADVYGELAFQYTEDGPDFTPAESTTGLSGNTLREYARVCAAVARDRRRPELPFGHHREVYALEPAEQERWLDAAVANDWTRDQLRRAIKEDGSEPDPGQQVIDPPVKSRGEWIEEAANRVFHQSQKGKDGFWITPDEAMVQLGAAIGELD